MPQRNVRNCQAITAATPTTLTFSGCAMSPISAMGQGGRRFARNLPLQLGGKEFLIYKLYLIGKNIVVMVLEIYKTAILGSRRLQLPTNHPPGIVCFPRTWTQGGVFGKWRELVMYEDHFFSFGYIIYQMIDIIFMMMI